MTKEQFIAIVDKYNKEHDENANHMKRFIFRLFRIRKRVLVHMEDENGKFLGYTWAYVEY